MKRNTKLEEILFPIELCDIFFELPKTHQLSLFGNRKAVVNTRTGKLFSIVSQNYRLVTNREAIELAKQCFSVLFQTANMADMEIFNIITPNSKSFCHVDIIHKDYMINLGAREAWLPYIRMTNSYDKSRALRFDLGFCRRICNNGVIFERETIEYKFYHTRYNIAPMGKVDISFEKLQRLEQVFVAYITNLADYEVPREYVLPIICKGLEIQFDVNSDDEKKREQERNRFSKFTRGANELANSYYRELGENAYAVLNIATDFASNPFPYTPASVIDTFQKRAGKWIESFVKQIRDPDFRFENYLKEHLELFRN